MSAAVVVAFLAGVLVGIVGTFVWAWFDNRDAGR